MLYGCQTGRLWETSDSDKVARTLDSELLLDVLEVVLLLSGERHVGRFVSLISARRLEMYGVWFSDGGSRWRSDSVQESSMSFSHGLSSFDFQKS